MREKKHRTKQGERKDKQKKMEKEEEEEDSEQREWEKKTYFELTLHWNLLRDYCIVKND